MTVLTLSTTCLRFGASIKRNTMWKMLLRFSIAFIALAKSMASRPSPAFQFRPATTDDVTVAHEHLIQAHMNPDSVLQEHLLVACNDSSGLLGFGQIRPLDDEYSELTSLFVLPNERHKGIGKGIFRKLLERHDDQEKTTTVCLLTLRPTMPFYEPFGFVLIDEDELRQLPTLQLEFEAGSKISPFLRDNIVCMVRK